MESPRERFSKIYLSEAWGRGEGSGKGSSPEYCSSYMSWLQELMRTEKIRSVLDVGCGDWKYSRHMDWSSLERYMGVDTVSSILYDGDVEPNIHLGTADVTIPGSLKLLFAHYTYDLVIMKDILMHLTDEEIAQVVSELVECPYRLVIVSNCWRFVRDKSKNGQTRSVDNRYSWAALPFDHPTLLPLGLEVQMYHPRSRKNQVSLGRGPRKC